MVPVDLKKNGANIPVTKDNRSVLFFFFLSSCLVMSV